MKKEGIKLFDTQNLIASLIDNEELDLTVRMVIGKHKDSPGRRATK